MLVPCPSEVGKDVLLINKNFVDKFFADMVRVVMKAKAIAAENTEDTEAQEIKNFRELSVS